MRHKPTQNHSVLVGLMLHHSHDDYEYWRLDISKEDQDAIFRILEKYDTSGSPMCDDSMRGSLRIYDVDTQQVRRPDY